MTKAPTPTEMSKGQSDNTNNATNKFEYTAIADRLRTVSWNNYGHPTGGHPTGEVDFSDKRQNRESAKGYYSILGEKSSEDMASKIEVPRDVRISKGP